MLVTRAKNKIFSAQESALVEHIYKGCSTLSALSEKVYLSQEQAEDILHDLCSRGLIKYDIKNREYVCSIPIIKPLIYIDCKSSDPMFSFLGNDHNGEKKLFVCRGDWYEFDADFDVNRIVWNFTDLKSTSNIDVQKQFIDHVKKASEKLYRNNKNTNEQLAGFEHLVDKRIHYNDVIKIDLKVIGASVCDVELVFSFGFFDKTRVRSQIDTKQLIDCLAKGIDERNYEKDIRLDTYLRASDFIFSGNYIPISWVNDDCIKVLKITRKGVSMELSYIHYNSDNSQKLVNKAILSPKMAVEDIMGVLSNDNLFVEQLTKLNFYINEN